MTPAAVVEAPPAVERAEVCLHNLGGANINPVVIDLSRNVPMRLPKDRSQWDSYFKWREAELGEPLRLGDLSDGAIKCVNVPNPQFEKPRLGFAEPRVNRSVRRLGGDIHGVNCEFPRRWVGRRLEFTYRYRSGFVWGCKLTTNSALARVEATP